MKPLVLAILCTVACGCNKNKQGATTPSPEDSGGDVLAKKISVSWGITQQGSSSEVFLQTTDETGKQVSYPLGRYAGACEVIQPAAEMKALTGVHCMTGNAGVELHLVITPPDIIVVKMPVELGVTPDPMSREEIQRVTVPAGTAIEAH